MCQAHNKQLQRTVSTASRRAASASFHCAHAARFTRQRAAAELRRYARPILLLLFTTLCVVNVAHASDSVVLGRAVDQEMIRNVASDCDPPELDEESGLVSMCLGYNWFRWVLSIDRTLVGPSVAGRVITVRRSRPANTVFPGVAPSA